MKHVLIVTLPDSEPKQYVLKGKRIGLGRGRENDIQLSVDAISSSHLEFRKAEEGYELIDLESTNGTRLNGKKLGETVTLADGDRLMIGETVPAHFLILAEGETWVASTDSGSDADQKSAAEFVSMSQKLETLEADIEKKEEEAATLDAKLTALKESYQSKLTEYGQARLELERLEQEVEAKKQAGITSSSEIEKLEEDLMVNTQKVKVMSTNLAAQQQQIDQLETQKAQPPAPAPAARPAPVQPAKPAPVATPAPAAAAASMPAAQPAAPTQVARVAAPAQAGQPAPAGGGPKPLVTGSPGAKTMKLTKRPAPPARKTVIRKKR